MRRRSLVAGAGVALASGPWRRAAAEGAGGPIRIGVALSQTGDLADSAGHYFDGLKLWRDQVNAGGGLLGRPVGFVTYDDRSDAATSARLYERLITSDEVDVLMSPLGSGTTATGSAVAERHKRIFINAGGAAEKIQQRGFRYVFQTAAPSHSYQQQIEPMARSYGFKTFAWVSRDFPAARDAVVDLREILARIGGRLVIDSYFPQGTADYSSYIAQARQLDPDVWFSTAYPNEAIEMIRQLRAVNYLPRLFICNGVSQDDFIKAAGRDGEQATGTSVYEPSLRTAGNDAFVAAFRTAYGAAPGYYSAFGFVGGTVLAAAIREAGSVDNEKLRTVLTGLKLDTVMGRHEVDPKTGGQLGVSGLLVQILGGKREVIWPEALRTATPRIPAQPWSQR